jgi:regulation of enolase protein 1 (concanavalin A-like superfamily)
MQWWTGMVWLNEPPHCSVDDGILTLRTARETDFWQETHYGFRRDDGHFLHRAVPGDFDAEVVLQLDPNAKYDQAGLMVRRDPGSWLKTSLEFEPDGPSNLGAVVTNAGLSDWSMQPVTGFAGRLAFRVARRGTDYTVHAAVDGAALGRIRLARLHADEGGPILVGPYACSPTGVGCTVAISSFRVTAAT